MQNDSVEEKDRRLASSNSAAVRSYATNRGVINQEHSVVRSTVFRIVTQVVDAAGQSKGFVGQSQRCEALAVINQWLRQSYATRPL